MNSHIKIGILIENEFNVKLPADEFNVTLLVRLVEIVTFLKYEFLSKLKSRSRISELLFDEIHFQCVSAPYRTFKRFP